MSNAETTATKERVIGRPFKPGVSGNPLGRPKGSRHRLSSQYIDDLAVGWGEVGINAVRKCASTDPAAFCRLISSLLPKQLDVSGDVSIDVSDFVGRFRSAIQALGNEPPRRLPKMKIINGG